MSRLRLPQIQRFSLSNVRERQEPKVANAKILPNLNLAQVLPAEAVEKTTVEDKCENSNPPSPPARKRKRTNSLENELLYKEKFEKEFGALVQKPKRVCKDDTSSAGKTEDPPLSNAEKNVSRSRSRRRRRRRRERSSSKDSDEVRGSSEESKKEHRKRRKRKKKRRRDRSHSTDSSKARSSSAESKHHRKRKKKKRNRRDRSKSSSRDRSSSSDSHDHRKRRSRRRRRRRGSRSRAGDLEHESVPDVVIRVARPEVRMPSRKDYNLDICCEMNPNFRAVLMDEKLRSFAAYLPNPFDEDLLNEWFKITMKNIIWKQPEVGGKRLPRYAAFFVSPGCKCQYRYSGTEWEGKEFPSWFQEITREVMKHVNVDYFPNSCNINLYENGKHSVGWHADNEPLFESKHRDCLIISLSLGATRRFQFRKLLPGERPGEKGRHTKPTTLPLRNGDLMSMEGLFQRFYSHRVVKDTEIDEPRINFTWRWITLHFAKDGCKKNSEHNGAPGHYFSFLKNTPIYS